MRNPRGIGTFLIFTFLVIILLLQIICPLKSARSNDRFDQLNQILQASKDPVRSDGAEAAEDEGDWLVWGFRVEPKTLNQIR